MLEIMVTRIEIDELLKILLLTYGNHSSILAVQHQRRSQQGPKMPEITTRWSRNGLQIPISIGHTVLFAWNNYYSIITNNSVVPLGNHPVNVSIRSVVDTGD
jgi:hypothetical protein